MFLKPQCWYVEQSLPERSQLGQFMWQNVVLEHWATCSETNMYMYSTSLSFWHLQVGETRYRIWCKITSFLRKTLQRLVWKLNKRVKQACKIKNRSGWTVSSVSFIEVSPNLFACACVRWFCFSFYLLLFCSCFMVGTSAFGKIILPLSHHLNIWGKWEGEVVGLVNLCPRSSLSLSPLWEDKHKTSYPSHFVHKRIRCSV